MKTQTNILMNRVPDPPEKPDEPDVPYPVGPPVPPPEIEPSKIPELPETPYTAPDPSTEPEIDPEPERPIIKPGLMLSNFCKKTLMDPPRFTLF